MFSDEDIKLADEIKIEYMRYIVLPDNNSSSTLLEFFFYKLAQLENEIKKLKEPQGG